MNKETPRSYTDAKGTSKLERLALCSTTYIGSLPSLVLHTIFFVGIFGLQWLGYAFDQIMLILTTAVSLEAIYLAIFIQMTVNHQARQIEEVSEDVEDIQEDVEEISKDIDEIQEDVEEIQEDVEDIQEETEEESASPTESEKIHNIQKTLEELLREVQALKQ